MIDSICPGWGHHVISRGSEQLERFRVAKHLEQGIIGVEAMYLMDSRRKEYQMPQANDSV